ncbi:MAG TPA: GTP cyclohydrolase I [Patescibacteria group bacterium]|nr:GTP cyclohydrolase I [Patescibacteria group bacterium]
MKKLTKQDQKTSKGLSVQNLNLQGAVRRFFVQLGENPDRDGIKETPKRFETAIKYMLGGYDRSFEGENKLFDNLTKYKDIIILKNINFFSMCEHHLLPFYGYAHVGYIPGKRVLGISKLARAVDIYSRRLQDQETLGYQVAEAIMKTGKARGVAVLIEGRHLCNAARGVEKNHSIMVTNLYLGKFEDDINLQNKFLELVRERKSI